MILNMLMGTFALMNGMWIRLFYDSLYIGCKDKVKRSYGSQPGTNNGSPLAFALENTIYMLAI